MEGTPIYGHKMKVNVTYHPPPPTSPSLSQKRTPSAPYSTPRASHSNSMDNLHMSDNISTVRIHGISIDSVPITSNAFKGSKLSAKRATIWSTNTQRSSRADNESSKSHKESVESISIKKYTTPILPTKQYKTNKNRKYKQSTTKPHESAGVTFLASVSDLAVSIKANRWIDKSKNSNDRIEKRISRKEKPEQSNFSIKTKKKHPRATSQIPQKQKSRERQFNKTSETKRNYSPLDRERDILSEVLPQYRRMQQSNHVRISDIVDTLNTIIYPSESYECANVTCDSMQLKQIKLKVWNDSLTRRHTQQGSGVRRKITKSENIKNKV